MAFVILSELLVGGAGSGVFAFLQPKTVRPIPATVVLTTKSRLEIVFLFWFSFFLFIFSFDLVCMAANVELK